MAEEQVGIYTRELPGVREMYGSWASGKADERIGFAVAVAQTRAGELAADLYALHVLEFSAPGYAFAVRRVKDWGYTEAAEFVTSRKRQAAIRDFRLSWGRQAARDGLCLALWGHLRGCGLAARAAQFDIGGRPYQRVRDHVRDRASMRITEFDACLGAAIGID